MLVEQAFALYSQGFLSLEKARDLAEMSKYEFGLLVEKRDISWHSGQEELEEDIAYAGGE